MAKYYHGTSRQNADAILREGLRPDKSQRKDEPGKFAFMSHTREGALAFAPGGKYKAGSGGVVLEINAPSGVTKNFRTDLGEFVRSPVNIPSKYIRESKD